MIKLVKEGQFELVETYLKEKILFIDTKNAFRWELRDELLYTKHKYCKTDCVLSVGKYRMYEVKHDLKLTSAIHLELCVGPYSWQGYLLENGLPNSRSKHKEIAMTNEIITKATLLS